MRLDDDYIVARPRQISFPESNRGIVQSRFRSAESACEYACLMSLSSSQSLQMVIPHVQRERPVVLHVDDDIASLMMAEGALDMQALMCCMQQTA